MWNTLKDNNEDISEISSDIELLSLFLILKKCDALF